MTVTEDAPRAPRAGGAFVFGPKIPSGVSPQGEGADSPHWEVAMESELLCAALRYGVSLGSVAVFTTIPPP